MAEEVTVKPGFTTRVVLLGVGNPMPDPDRSGPATAVVVGDRAYLVDIGPGTVRRAAQASIEKGIDALEPANIRVAFVTHLHSDHTLGYPDLILTPWTNGGGRREVPLEVYGPKGIKAMTGNLLEAYREDIRVRSEGMEHAPKDGWKVVANEISAGIVYKDDRVTVTAFPTKHGEWERSFGYRFDTADRSVVITGDTTPTPETIAACNGCDVLVHEALSMKFVERHPEMREYAAKYHTTTSQLAVLAKEARPKLLVLHHNPISMRPDPRRPMVQGPSDLLAEMQGLYGGKTVVGKDLDIY